MRIAPTWYLWIEFAAFYVVAPVGMAVFLPPSVMFPVLFAVTFVGLILLHITPGFVWRDLLHGWRAVTVRHVLAVSLAVLVVSLGVMWVFARDGLFMLIQERPMVMLMIAALYPFLSALPQEIVFRPLFFRRYIRILPRGRAVLVLNAALFSLAHLMYWSWIVALMTFAGGLVFAWAYEERQSFPLAVVLHAVAGVILFAVGMGAFFYSGNVVRPF